MKPKTKPVGAMSVSARTKTKGKVSKKKSGGSNSSGACSPAYPLPEFLDVVPFDHERHCPRYCILVSRDAEEDPATSDELDPVQHELEQILLHNMNRQGSITNQLSTLTDGEVASTSEMQAESSKERSTPTPLILRRLQSDLINAPHPSRSVTPPSNPQTAPKLKIRLPNPSTTRRPKPMVDGSSLQTSASFDKPVFAPIPLLDAKGRRRMYFWPQNHMPDKFWQFVSEHCDTIEKEDVSGIRELLNENSEDYNSKFYRCPGLGKHYSLRWSQEDARRSEEAKKTEGKGGVKKRKLTSPEPTSGGDSSDPEREKKVAKTTSPDRKAKKKTSSSAAAAPDTNVLKNGHSEGEHYCLGPLTERLVQALIEEGNVSEEAGDWMGNFGEVKDIPDVNGMVSPNKTLVKSLNLGNMAALEKRIQKELEEQGLLDGEDESDEDEPTSSKQGDEVTEELQKRQEELRSVCEVNRGRLQQILEHMEKSQTEQELESQLKEMDREVMEMYGRFYSLVPKRKPSSKKERDQLWKSLRERQKLVRKLDALYDV